MVTKSENKRPVSVMLKSKLFLVHCCAIFRNLGHFAEFGPFCRIWAIFRNLGHFAKFGPKFPFLLYLQIIYHLWNYVIQSSGFCPIASQCHGLIYPLSWIQERMPDINAQRVWNRPYIPFLLTFVRNSVTDCLKSVSISGICYHRSSQSL